MARPLFRTAVVATLVTVLAGCSTIGIKPWERDILPRSEMALDSGVVYPDPLLWFAMADLE